MMSTLVRASLASVALAVASGVSGQIDTEGAGNCAIGHPCFESAEYLNGVLTFRWRSQDHFDAFNVRIAGPNTFNRQYETGGGYGGNYAFPGPVRGASYTLRVQGCNRSAFGRSRCSSWIHKTFSVPPLPVTGPPGTVNVPPPKTLPTSGHKFRWQPASSGSVPKGALGIGRDSEGQKLFACRGPVEGGSHIGKVRVGLGGCHIGFAGAEISVANYEVLLDPQESTTKRLKGLIRYVTASNGTVPDHAINGGRERSGTILFVCVATHADGSLQIGKLSGHLKGCNYSYAGAEVGANSYLVPTLP